MMQIKSGSFLKETHPGFVNEILGMLIKFNRFTRSNSDPERFVNKPNKEGITPLYLACLNGNFEVCCEYLRNNSISLKGCEDSFGIQRRSPCFNTGIQEFFIDKLNFYRLDLKNLIQFQQLHQGLLTVLLKNSMGFIGGIIMKF